MSIDGCKILTIPHNTDDRGSIAFVEYETHIDFLIRRVYWLYNIQQNRGANAHKALKQLIICTSGEVEIVIDDSKDKQSFILNSPNVGLLIEKPLWRDIVQYKNNPVLMVLASDIYKEDDYIRSYEEFKKWKLSF